MEMEFLGDSSCISSAGYEAGYLTVEFETGEVYTYSEVPPQVYGAFKRSTSKGYYFNRAIRNNYSFTEGPAPDLDVKETGKALLETMLGPEFFDG
jgi:hypothetical protein